MRRLITLADLRMMLLREVSALGVLQTNGGKQNAVHMI